MKKTIVCIATLDTKGQEIKFIKDIIEQRGHKTLAAGAIVGMVESPKVEIVDKPLIVISMNGTTTPCGSKVMSMHGALVCHLKKLLPKTQLQCRETWMKMNH